MFKIKNRNESIFIVNLKVEWCSWNANDVSSTSNFWLRVFQNSIKQSFLFFTFVFIIFIFSLQYYLSKIRQK